MSVPAPVLEVLTVSPDRVLEGDTVEVGCALHNPTAELVTIGHGRAAYGRLVPRGPDLLHDTMAQVATDPVFFSQRSILTPGTARGYAHREQAIDPEMVVSVDVLMYETAATRVLRCVDAGGPVLRYSPVSIDDLRDPAAADASCDLIVQGPARPAQAQARVGLRVAPRDFSLEAARRIFGGCAERARWSHDGWLLASADRLALVQPGQVTEFPSGAWPVLVEHEGSRGRFTFRLTDPEATAIGRVFGAYPGDGMYRSGTFVDVPRDRLLDALDVARREGLEVIRMRPAADDPYDELRPGARRSV